MPPSIPKNSENAVEAAGIAMPQKISREIDHHSTLAAAETRASKDSDLKVRKIKRQIEEAIRRRAISGVTVYFVRDTAHLKGRVATDSQKAAAEKAARRVQGVKNVRSSIEVDSPSRDG
jgi:osmotically-inducible protein OsmY